MLTNLKCTRLIQSRALQCMSVCERACVCVCECSHVFPFTDKPLVDHSVCVRCSHHRYISSKTAQCSKSCPYIAPRSL